MRDGATTTLSGVVVEDPQTVEFTLTSAVPYFPALAGHLTVRILKKDNVTSGGEEWWRTPVTSGFFKVTEYTPGDQATMTLERNEHWWREPAKLSRIEMTLVADPQTQLVQYDNDEVDGMVCQPAEFAQATKPNGERAEELYWDAADATWYFGFFTFKPPFEDVKVRQAFASALDLNAISVAGLNGIYPAQKRILRPGFPCGGDQQLQPAYDADGGQGAPDASRTTAASTSCRRSRSSSRSRAGRPRSAPGAGSRRRSSSSCSRTWASRSKSSARSSTASRSRSTSSTRLTAARSSA